jgi:TonB family protein
LRFGFTVAHPRIELARLNPGFTEMTSRISLWLSIFATAGVSLASVQSPFTQPGHPDLNDRERQTWKMPAHAAEYRELPHMSERLRCADTELPQALATPSPLVVTGSGPKVKVNFVIGTDGRVHSPLILQSEGRLGDRDILRTVRTWRYRPATCNGVPTESEGNVEFSRH